MWFKEIVLDFGAFADLTEWLKKENSER